MMTSDQLFVFILEGERYAIYLPIVERVVPAVEIRPLPEIQDILLGAINVHGMVIPVLNIRKWFHLPDRDMELDDRIVIIKIHSGAMAFPVDAVEGVIMRSDREIIPAGMIMPHMNLTDGVVKIGAQMVFIYDFERLFSLELEEQIYPGMIGHSHEQPAS